MGEAGVPGLLVFGADLVPDVDGHERRRVVLIKEHGEPVRENGARVGDGVGGRSRDEQGENE